MKTISFLALAGLANASLWDGLSFGAAKTGHVSRRDPGVGCPGTLTAPYVAPVGVYPIQETEPDKNFGNTYPQVLITPGDVCTIFDIYLPPEAFYHACTLQFYFPYEDQLSDGASYTFSGPGNFYLAGYTGRGTNSSVTWATQPEPDPAIFSPGAKVFLPGNAYDIFGGFPFSCLGTINTTFPPSIGEFRVGGRLCSNDTFFSYTQSEASCSLGLFVEYSTI